MTTTYKVLSDGFPHIDKDPSAQLPYVWDWTDWLSQVGAVSISSATVTVDTGVTKVGAVAISGALVTQVITGGTAGTSYKATCQVTTNNALIDERTVYLDVKDR